jgi:hypothetical protein
VVNGPQRALVDDLTPSILTVAQDMSWVASRLTPSSRFHEDPVFLRDRAWVSFAQRSLPHKARPAFFFELDPCGMLGVLLGLSDRAPMFAGIWPSGGAS